MAAADLPALHLHDRDADAGPGDHEVRLMLSRTLDHPH
jgi:hypothetical protein